MFYELLRALAKAVLTSLRVI